MEIKTTYAGLDLSVESGDETVDNKNTYEVTIGSQLIITTKHDWLKINNIIIESMEFIDNNL